MIGYLIEGKQGNLIETWYTKNTAEYYAEKLAYETKRNVTLWEFEDDFNGRDFKRSWKISPRCFLYCDIGKGFEPWIESNPSMSYDEAKRIIRKYHRDLSKSWPKAKWKMIETNPYSSRWY